MLISDILQSDVDNIISLIIVFIYIYNIMREHIITTNIVKGIMIDAPFINTSNFMKNIGLGGIPANPIIDITDTSFNTASEPYLILFWIANKLMISVSLIVL